MKVTQVGYSEGDYPCDRDIGRILRGRLSL